MSRTSSRVKAIASIFAAVLLLLLSAWLWLNRQHIADSLVVGQYQPTAQIAGIADRVKMTDSGKFVFYASTPEINDASTFNQHCERQEQASAILGCYAGGRIYLYAIENDELDGVVEVTAAHEMLHAVWQRMSKSERDRIGEQLTLYYAQHKTKELEERMAYYDRNQPGEEVNELHSILGTEFGDLGSELEQHYAKYFKERARIVALHTGYSEKFTTIKNQTERLGVEIRETEKTINAAIATYNADMEAVNSEIAGLRDSYDSVDRTSAASVNSYNQKRAELLSRAESIEARYAAIQEDIRLYNEKIASYNKLALHAQELSNSIDSMVAPQSKTL